MLQIRMKICVVNVVIIAGLLTAVAESRAPIHLDLADFEKVVVEDLLYSKSEVKNSGCKCVNYNCGCCAHMEVSKIELNETGCVNVSYLPDQYGISLTFSLNGHVYVNETISAKNPPPLCFAIPHLKDFASLCIKFYNLSVSSSKLSGCVKIQARLYHVDIEDIPLGCFKLGKGVNVLYGSDPSRYLQIVHQQTFPKKTIRAQNDLKLIRLVV
ncbi:uncharacterized protein LOC106158476 [Lingula anatina]|uniref:Uncharacterized protein LOC106158476 n=1 Tax=Lingula anatina TaxID=7574 RepID=A0A1S3HV92_LINAN|nr:uncharacterized protein LOC106158476 [Lingula anatina]XP_013389939.1 uncharacterized protein LOC106158476 [Lingula anatina]|eukprot:XP_013389938.1 uncharacterized protein LOC106158476 [Lingula anatina]